MLQFTMNETLEFNDTLFYHDNNNISTTPNSSIDIDDDWFGYITEGVLLTSISACGFIGNLLSVIVLLRSSLKGNFSYQLTSLAGE